MWNLRNLKEYGGKKKVTNDHRMVIDAIRMVLRIFMTGTLQTFGI